MTDNSMLVKLIMTNINKEPIRNEGKILCQVLENGVEKMMYIEEALLTPLCDITTATDSISEPISPKENKFEWGDTDTKALLDLYHECLPKVGPMKTFRNKKVMWLYISQELQSKLNIARTPLQCESRYKTVLRRRVDARKTNKTSGETLQDIQFEPEVEKILSLDDSLQPEVLISGDTLKVTKRQHSPVTQKQTKKPRSELIDFFKESFKQKEENKERRHKEKLELLRELFHKE